jgi:hypothetical protein
MPLVQRNHWGWQSMATWMFVHENPVPLATKTSQNIKNTTPIYTENEWCGPLAG